MGLASNWAQWWKNDRQPRRNDRRVRETNNLRLFFEPMEDRCVPATYAITGPTPGTLSSINSYVSRVPGGALNTNPVGRTFPLGDQTQTAAWTVAGGDLLGEGVKSQIVACTRVDDRPFIFVYDLQDNGSLTVRESFFPFAPDVVSRAFVAIGDVDGNGRADIILGTGSVGPDPGFVRVIRDLNLNGLFGDDNGSAFQFQPFGANFQGAIRVAAGNLDGLPAAELVLSTAGTGSSPLIQVYDLSTGTATLLSSFSYDFGVGYVGGAFVAVGRISGAQGFGQIIVGQGNADRFGVGGSFVAVFQDPTASDNFTVDGIFTQFAANPENPQVGVPVAAGSLDGDIFAEILTGQLRGAEARLKSWSNPLGSPDFVLSNNLIAYSQEGTPAGEINRGDYVAYASNLAPVPQLAPTFLTSTDLSAGGVFNAMIQGSSTRNNRNL